MHIVNKTDAPSQLTLINKWYNRDIVHGAISDRHHCGVTQNEVHVPI